jgi:phosphatidylserine/phosphatidylglycerophosphate/cardiolipin synthase-like enzyme
MPVENGLSIIAIEAMTLAKSLPFSLLETLIQSIGACDLKNWAAAKNQIIQNIAHPHYRTLTSNFLNLWQSQAREVTPQAVALAVLTAAQSEKRHREHQSIELVWTGPDVSNNPLRRTEQALLQVIDSASQRICIVSYAVYNIPRVCTALIQAANRGVVINVIIETPNRLEGKNAYDTLKALGSAAASRCQVYFWPLEKRKKDANGKPGILHVKCAVADGQRLFLSSANLTDYAFTTNMELGILITGGSLPVEVESHFHQMIQAGVLENLAV